MTDNGFKISRRHLPHWTFPGAVYFITFRTKDTSLSEVEQKLVVNHIIKGDNSYYCLLAAAVMPDHVHMLLSPREKLKLDRIMKGIKGVSARKPNKLRKTSGTIWKDESFDRIIRNENELIEKINYMLNNPVKRGLTENPYHYPGWYVNNNYF